MAAKQYFDLITDCLRWADEAENSAARETFLALAETWKKVAELERKTSGREVRPFLPELLGRPRPHFQR